MKHRYAALKGATPDEVARRTGFRPRQLRDGAEHNLANLCAAAAADDSLAVHLPHRRYALHCIHHIERGYVSKEGVLVRDPSVSK